MQKIKVIGAKLIELAIPAHIKYWHYYKNAVITFVHNKSPLRIIILTQYGVF